MAKSHAILVGAFIAVIYIAADAAAAAPQYLQYGYQCLNLRDYPKAQGYFKAEIALNNSVEAHVALAQAYFFNKQRAESERELERASSLDPTAPGEIEREYRWRKCINWLPLLGHIPRQKQKLKRCKNRNMPNHSNRLAFTMRA